MSSLPARRVTAPVPSDELLDQTQLYSKAHSNTRANILELTQHEIANKPTITTNINSTFTPITTTSTVTPNSTDSNATTSPAWMTEVSSASLRTISSLFSTHKSSILSKHPAALTLFTQLIQSVTHHNNYPDIDGSALQLDFSDLLTKMSYVQRALKYAGTIALTSEQQNQQALVRQREFDAKQAEIKLLRHGVEGINTPQTLNSITASNGKKRKIASSPNVSTPLSSASSASTVFKTPLNKRSKLKQFSNLPKYYSSSSCSSTAQPTTSTRRLPASQPRNPSAFRRTSDKRRTTDSKSRGLNNYLNGMPSESERSQSALDETEEKERRLTMSASKLRAKKVVEENENAKFDLNWHKKKSIMLKYQLVDPFDFQ